MDRAVAVIPARGGSKRIPRKNIRPFHGKPLIAYSIETARESGLFERVIVSTDDPEIAETARSFGAETPFLRPSSLSDDFTSTDAVVDHAVNWLKREGMTFDYVCTVYATAPFLEPAYLKEGLERLKNSDAVYTFAATSMPFPIQRTFTLDAKGRCRMFFPEHYNTRSQDLEPAYQDAGQFYWRHMKRHTEENMFGKDSIPIIIPRHLVQDIDTEEDWKRAEIMYRVLKESR
ncbi:pseudaminic acid cytidylyltransferase [Hydrogenimonas sp. SS33]|uniref:pseudaminic acid cytidylyltransferase n=1 Tax=Hydrogenimonas leucolamina TaxID=2954236 RepID=UPI00336C173E